MATMRPAVACLLMREPVGFRDRGGPRQAVRRNVGGLDAATRFHARPAFGDHDSLDGQMKRCWPGLPPALSQSIDPFAV